MSGTQQSVSKIWAQLRDAYLMDEEHVWKKKAKPEIEPVTFQVVRDKTCEHPEDSREPLEYAGHAPDPDEWECADCGTTQMRSVHLPPEPEPVGPGFPIVLNGKTVGHTSDEPVSINLPPSVMGGTIFLNGEPIGTADPVFKSFSNVPITVEMSMDMADVTSFDDLMKVWMPIRQRRALSVVTSEDKVYDDALSLYHEARKLGIWDGRDNHACWEVDNEADHWLHVKMLANSSPITFTFSSPYGMHLMGLPITVVDDKSPKGTLKLVVT